MVEIISAVIISTAAVSLLIAVSCVAVSVRSNTTRNSKAKIPPSPLTSNPLLPGLPTAQQYSTNGPRRFTRLFHGTSRQNALEIYKTGLWLIGKSKPPAVWMTSMIEIAKVYAEDNGYIVAVDVDRALRLKTIRDGVFIFEVPDVKVQDEYLEIEGLRPVGIIDVNGNKIK